MHSFIKKKKKTNAGMWPVAAKAEVLPDIFRVTEHKWWIMSCCYFLVLPGVLLFYPYVNVDFSFKFAENIVL